MRNHAGRTPLVEAASLGKVAMFQHIYSKRRRPAWAYGSVSIRPSIRPSVRRPIRSELPVGDGRQDKHKRFLELG